jgi:hypothetical protein
MAKDDQAEVKAPSDAGGGAVGRAHIPWHFGLKSLRRRGIRRVRDVKEGAHGVPHVAAIAIRNTVP